MSYTLTATLGNKTETVVLDTTEDDAIFDAVNIIMDRAYADKTGPWAVGAITLTDPEDNVIQSMEAKQ